MKRFALAGNPNCGKTTLFNSLTGSTAHVGNWPGVTVASIVRKLKGKPSLGSDCAGCSHQGQCNGHCCNQDPNVDWSKLVAKRKEELKKQKALEEVENPDDKDEQN